VSAEALLASPFATLPDIIRAHAAERPDHPALIEGDETLTYGGLAALMDRIAVALQRDGVGSGDAVAPMRQDLDQLRGGVLGHQCRGRRAADLS
jgi:long-chain acyl-CoA synthetase